MLLPNKINYKDSYLTSFMSERRPYDGIGLGKMEYSFSTAVGLFESVVGFALVITGNYLSRKFTDSSIW